jgi:BirA family biotin operon repressor/biotin-[acetyl-CoA-carboxylase] ligase
VRSAFHDRFEALHEEASFRIPGSDRTIAGTVQGIAETGALRIHTPDGLETIHAGDVTTRREA